MGTYRGKLLFGEASQAATVYDSSKKGAVPFGWFNLVMVGPSSSPPVFASFAEMARSLLPLPSWAAREAAPDVNAACPVGPNAVHTNEAREPPSFSLSLDPSTFPALPSVGSPENPTSVLQYSSPPDHRNSSHLAVMAYQRADPRPFISEGFQWNDIPDRRFISRTMAPLRPPANNEDLAIVSFDPLPGNQLNFNAVRNVVREFLEGRHVHFHGILPCHLGQA